MGFRYFHFIGIALFAVALSAQAAGSVGFVQGNIWYSKDPFVAGDLVRIYSGVFNSGSEDIVGEVAFFDNNLSIGTTKFSATTGGRLQEVWIDWRASVGEHVISAKITRAAISRAGKPDQSIEVIDAESGTSSRIVAAPPPPPEKVSTALAPSVAHQSLAAAQVAAAAVTDTVDATADSFRAPLVAKQAELEKRIADFKRRESAVVETATQQTINAAAGSSVATSTQSTGTPSDTLARLGLQLYRLVVVAALYVIDHRPLLYTLLVVFVLWLIRLVWRRIVRS